MQTVTHSKTTTIQPQPQTKTTIRATPRRPTMTWKPAPGGLTREELSKIIADQLG